MFVDIFKSKYKGIDHNASKTGKHFWQSSTFSEMRNRSYNDKKVELGPLKNHN